MGKYKFKLEFDNKSLIVNQAVMGKIFITDATNKPVKNLEPVMGAFAHIVGFYDVFKTVAHVHPMGIEPTQASDRG